MRGCPRKNYSSDMMNTVHYMYSICQCNPPRNSNDRDMLHEHTRRKETKKYLKESYYHRIKCIAATFLATFMWRRPLNNTTLATTTHRKPESVSDGTCIQVRVQMINRWKVKIIQRKVYKVKDSSWREDRKKEKENTVAIQIVFISNCYQYI